MRLQVLTQICIKLICINNFHMSVYVCLTPLSLLNLVQGRVDFNTDLTITLSQDNPYKNVKRPNEKICMFLAQTIQIKRACISVHFLRVWRNIV